MKRIEIPGCAFHAVATEPDANGAVEIVAPEHLRFTVGQPIAVDGVGLTVLEVQAGAGHQDIIAGPPEEK